jgi:GT2 family glycosyltransferase
MNRAAVGVVIPVFDDWTRTRLCLDRLRASHFRDFVTIVVDHGTTDRVQHGLADGYPEVLRVPASNELWWAGACNAGIKVALELGVSHVVLLNHDSYVGAETLGRLYHHARKAPGSIVAALQRSTQKGTIDFPGVDTCFLLGFPTVHRPYIWFPSFGKNLVRVPLILGGRAVLIPANTFAMVGLFDEKNLPHYGADHDFYLRCHASGTLLLIATDADVYIDDGSTTLAYRYGNLTVRQFLNTLRDRRSHKNLRDLTALFRLHYPIRGLHYLGVALNIARYAALYAIKRSLRLLNRVAHMPSDY